MTAVFPWVNAIYGLSNQLTFRSYAYYAFQIYVVIIDCISGEMFILVTNFFWSNQVFLDLNQNIQLRTSHHCRRRCFFLYHSTRNFRNYFVSWGNSLSLHTESSYFSPFTTNVRMHKGASPVSIGENKMTHVD